MQQDRYWYFVGSSTEPLLNHIPKIIETVDVEVETPTACSSLQEQATSRHHHIMVVVVRQTSHALPGCLAAWFPAAPCAPWAHPSHSPRRTGLGVYGNSVFRTHKVRMSSPASLSSLLATISEARRWPQWYPARHESSPPSRDTHEALAVDRIRGSCLIVFERPNAQTCHPGLSS